MSSNFNDTPLGTGGGGAGTGATDAGTTRDTGTTGGVGGGTAGAGGGLQTTGGAGAGAGTATAREGIAGTAQQYGQRIADAATQARDYMTDKAGAVGDKLRDLQNVDYRQVAEDAKQYARQNPGQALVISAAAGFLLGLLLRGSRR